VPFSAFADKGADPSPDTLLTVVKGRILRGFLLLAAMFGAALVLGSPAAADDARVLVAEFDNDVNPVTQDFLQDAMQRGVDDGYDAVVIEMDTPGGLSSSMREIVKSILSLPIPVIVYVSPPGSSADSAGAVIGQAADVLAMAPQTNIGSSTPISTSGEDLSDDLRKKVVNDAAAYVSELAREHGRNAAAAEAMVRDAANYGAREALERGVIDEIAPTLPELLETIDGRETQPKGLALQTAGASIDTVRMSFWQRALDILIDPNIIALMLSIGLIGIVVELWNPGLIFPGTVGAISLLVALYGLQVLPVSVAGALLMVLAIAFFVAELFVPSHGALTVAGAVTFVVGALMLFDPAGEAYQVSLWVAITIAATLALIVGVGFTKAVAARRRPPEVDVHRLIGGEAEVRRQGYVAVGGELWRARSVDGRPLVPGDRVSVDSVDDDLGLVVSSPANERS
jgi:membrane-bound serine protease (ClpP class)